MKYTPYPEELGQDTTWKALERAQKKMEHQNEVRSWFKNIRSLVGLDGYVDSLYSLVASRENVEDYNIMKSMVEFSSKINEVAGSSCNVERVLKKRLGGGFGPNIARAIGTLGSPVDLIGCLGRPDNVFTSTLPDNIQYHSLNEPGATCALEFADGKIMLTDFSPVNAVTWDLIKGKLGKDKFLDIMEAADAIGQGHWALVPHMNEIWQDWINEVFPSLKKKPRVFFIDPADMSKRPANQIKEMLSLAAKINEFEKMKVIISFNDKEIIQVLDALDRAAKIQDYTDYYTAGDEILKNVSINTAIIHSPHFATGTSENVSVHVKEGYTSNPHFTTAAGDHFNGGVLMAIASKKFQMDEALILGNAATAYFVRTGTSPDIQALYRFVSNYRSYVDKDIDEVL